MNKYKCNKCGIEKELTAEFFYKNKNIKRGFSYWCKDCSDKNRNKEKDRIRARNYARKNYHKHRNYTLKSKFDITLNDYDDLLKKQDGRCAICGMINSETKYDFSVDHDHKTGNIRGLLCTNCNLALGNFKDNPFVLLKAFKYLRPS